MYWDERNSNHRDPDDKFPPRSSDSILGLPQLAQNPDGNAQELHDR